MARCASSGSGEGRRGGGSPTSRRVSHHRNVLCLEEQRQSLSHNQPFMTLIRYLLFVSYRPLPSSTHLPEQGTMLGRHDVGTPGTCGTSRSNSTNGGVRAERPRQVTLSNRGSSLPPVPITPGFVTGRRWCSSRRSAILRKQRPSSSLEPDATPRGARRAVTKGSGLSQSDRPTCGVSTGTGPRSKSRKQAGCGSAGRVPFPPRVKSYRVTHDRAGRWHLAFAAIPVAVEGPGAGEIVGVDRGVVVSAALSTGEMLQCPRLTSREARRLRGLERRLAKSKRGSGRRRKVKTDMAKLKDRETARRRDWCVRKPLRTLHARRFDVIRVEEPPYQEHD